MTKPRARGELIVAKAYSRLAECVTAGLAAGWQRAHKHTDSATPEQIQEAQYDRIMLEITEAFDFPEAAE